MARQREHVLSAHGEQRNDPYYWLRDDSRESADVLAYLEAENEYTKAIMAPLDSLREQLFTELKSRVKADDASVPYRTDTGWYAERYEADKDLPIHVRWAQQSDWPQGEPEVLLDENRLGADYDFYQVGDYQVSPDGRWLAWSEDTLSRGIYQIRLRDLQADETIAIADEVIEQVGPSVVFSADGGTLFYLRLQDDTLIPWQLWRHTIGTDPADDVLVYQEDDASFYNTISRSRDGRWIVLSQFSTTTSDVRIIPAAAPDSAIRSLLPRERGHEFQADFLGDRVYLLTNRDAVNFRLVSVAIEQAADESQWSEILPHQNDALLAEHLVLRNYVVVEEIKDAVQRLRVLPLNGGDSFHITADEPAYTAYIDVNERTDTDVLRYAYASPATPKTIYDIDLSSGERTQRKQDFAGDDFDHSDYQVTRLEVTARDGESIPVTLLHQHGLKPNGSQPLLLQGYGSYGFSYLPSFRSDELSLVKRGFVVGIAHIRGGQERGRRWYDDGKLLNKKNTFTDFIDVGRALIEGGWAHPEKLAGSGRSAGGLLIGAVANLAPETFSVLIAGVPFVDVVTTMLDDSIPLTTYEYDEWGNPADERYYRYMLDYSPYDNVAAREYPDMLVTTGLWDPAVQYWEPAKWVARLRATKQGDSQLLMYTDMTAGHRGGSGRYDRLRDRSREYAFLLERLDMLK
ncbi:MAG: oligopeptidase B [Wenzhouxiangellaceae bacterium]